MAVVARPPLYVPRPAAEPFWSFAPPVSTTVLLAAGQVTFFGAIGQAPTKNWAEVTSYVPETIWVGAPRAPNPGILSGLVVGFFPTKQWQRDYDFVPDPVWTWNDMLGPVPDILLKPTAGQAPTKQWHYDYAADAVWSWTVPPNLTGNIAAAVTFFGQPGQAPTKDWAAWGTYVPDPVWTWTPQPATRMVVTTFVTFYGAPGQAPTRNWAPYYTYTPEPIWTANAVWGLQGTNDIGFRPPGGQPPTPTWSVHYRYDVTAAIWSWRMPPDRLLFLPPTAQFFGAVGQAPTQFWGDNYTYDVNAPIWVGRPVQGYTLVRPVVPPALQIPQITDTTRIQLPVNAVMEYLQPRREGDDGQIPEEILKKIFGE